jgi:hypothetical protein
MWDSVKYEPIINLKLKIKTLTPNNFKAYLYLYSQVVHFNSIYRATTTVKPSLLTCAHTEKLMQKKKDLL